jgi:hypothetical protein
VMREDTAHRISKATTTALLCSCTGNLQLKYGVLKP